MSSIFETVGTLNRALDFHLRRQNVLSSNVANLDTPGFQPQELVREGVSPSAPGHTLPMSTTSNAHLGGNSSQERMRLESRNEETVPMGADGNSVSLDREMAKISVNGIRYDGATKMISKKLGLLRYAANDGTGR